MIHTAVVNVQVYNLKSLMDTVGGKKNSLVGFLTHFIQISHSSSAIHLCGNTARKRRQGSGHVTRVSSLAETSHQNKTFSPILAKLQTCPRLSREHRQEEEKRNSWS